MLYIKTTQLKAALSCVAKKSDKRAALQGVLIEITACGDIHLVSTDSESLFFGRIPAIQAKWATNERWGGPLQIILPGDALKKAVTAQRDYLLIENLGAGHYLVNGISCLAIDSTFPAWRNVVAPALAAAMDEPAPMDWGRVATVESALRTWAESKTATVRVHGRGEGSGALVTGPDVNAFALVMPQISREITPDVRPSYPAAFDAENIADNSGSMA